MEMNKIQAMDTKKIAMTLFMGMFTFLAGFSFQNAQEDFVEYRGKIVESNSEKPLALASIGIEGSNVSTVSNTEGSFSLKVSTFLSINSAKSIFPFEPSISKESFVKKSNEN